MKKEKTLRQRLIRGFILAALIPVLIFALFSQINFWRGMKENMERQIQNNLRSSDQCLNMTLDKYETLLHDFCTESETVRTMEQMNEVVGEMDAERELMQEKLRHICTSNTGLAGIVIQTEQGEHVFYDRLNDSSNNNTWMKKIEIPDLKRGESFYGTGLSVAAEKEEVYLFWTAENIMSSDGKVLGTAIFCIYEEVVRNALTAGIDTESYLLDGEKIVSASDTSMIGKRLEDIKSKTFRYTKTKNEMSGFTICNVQPLSVYHHMREKQVLLLIFVAVVGIAVMIFLIYRMTRPYLKAVDEWLLVMNRVEKGDFSVKIQNDKKMPKEIRKIENGFNEMLSHVESLMEQVKQAVVEQKNAELYALEAQIDPHFLYNTLDTINWKAIENEQYEISEMVGALADILRYTVYNMGETTTIRQELGWLNEYILLQDAKKGKKIDVKIQVPEKYMGYKIHKLILQPLVENAIRHGFTGGEEKDILLIQIRESEEQLHIMIGNNGKRIPPDILENLNNENIELDGHMGIGNVRKRLKLYYGEKAVLYFESEEYSYTKVHLFIPGKEEKRCESQS